MASISSDSIIVLVILATLMSIPDLVLSDINNSTCPNNKDSICTTLPFNINHPPDVWLNVPHLSVDKISLVVENLKTHISLSTNVARLVSLNAGIDVSMDKVNLTITGVKAQVQLAIHLDTIAKIITRVMASLDLNPSLGSAIDDVFETVNNLLDILTDNGQLIHQIINSDGKIVNQVMGPANEILSSTIVGDYQQNMTFTGVSKTLENGYVIKQYSYLSLSSSAKSEKIFINIVFDALGNVSNTNVVNPPSTSPSSTSTPITGESVTNTTTTNSTAT